MTANQINRLDRLQELIDSKVGLGIQQKQSYNKLKRLDAKEKAKYECIFDPKAWGIKSKADVIPIGAAQQSLMVDGVPLNKIA